MWGSICAYSGQETTRCHIALVFLLDFADLSLILFILCHYCTPKNKCNAFIIVRPRISLFKSLAFLEYYCGFQSAHVHNVLSNFQKADGVAVMMG